MPDSRELPKMRIQRVYVARIGKTQHMRLRETIDAPTRLVRSDLRTAGENKGECKHRRNTSSQIEYSHGFQNAEMTGEAENPCRSEL